MCGATITVDKVLRGGIPAWNAPNDDNPGIADLIEHPMDPKI